jgi:hypothetical protein
VTKTVTFTSDQALQGVTIEAVPEIAGFVQIQPNTFAQVPAGQPKTIQLTFSAPAQSQFGAYDATIHVLAGRTTLPQTLKTSITYAVVALPPDPGEPGKATLEGIDSDRDGVRDDIQRLIGFMQLSPQQRAVMFRLASAMQQTIRRTGTADQTAYLVRNELIINRCLSYLLGEQYSATANGLDAAVLNTIERTKVYLTADAAFATVFGTTLGMPKDQAACQGLL